MSAKCALTSFMETRVSVPSAPRHLADGGTLKSFVSTRAVTHPPHTQSARQAGGLDAESAAFQVGWEAVGGQRGFAGCPAVQVGGVKLLRSSASVRFPADLGGYIL